MHPDKQGTSCPRNEHPIPLRGESSQRQHDDVCMYMHRYSSFAQDFRQQRLQQSSARVIMAGFHSSFIRHAVGTG